MVRRQFRLRTFFGMVAIAACFLAARVLVRGELAWAIPKAYALSLATATIFAAWRAAHLKEALGKSVLGLSLASGIVAALCGMTLGIEIAESLRSMDYFNWAVDWVILLRHATCLLIAGSVVGFYTIALVMAIRQQSSQA